MTATQQWLFLLFGYLATVSIELPILYAGLQKKHTRSQRVCAGLLLTAFTYPIVVLVLPACFALANLQSRFAFLLIAETYAPVAEILFFRFMHNQKLLAKPDRDAAVILAANLSSFLLGEAFLSQLIQSVIQSLTTST